MFTALLLGVGFFVHIVQAAKAGSHDESKSKHAEDLKARQTSIFNDNKAKHTANAEATNTAHADASLALEKKHELDRIDHKLKSIESQSKLIASLSNSKNKSSSKILSSLQDRATASATLSSELTTLKAKIQSDTTLTDLDTDADALTDLIAPKKN